MEVEPDGALQWRSNGSGSRVYSDGYRQRRNSIWYSIFDCPAQMNTSPA